MNWLWDGYIRPGEVTMLAGHEKIGKTTLLEGLTRAMEHGEPFLGAATTACTAAWASEEAATAFREREAQLGPAPPRALLNRREAMRLPWPELVQETVDRATEGGHALLVFDSFLRLTGLDGQPELENDASSVSGALRPLLLVPEELAVVYVHHLNRKGFVRGSSAMQQAIDHTVRLDRKRSTTRFKLSVTGRNPTPPRALIGDLDRDASPWEYLARGGRGSTMGDATALWDALAAAPEGLTYEEMGQYVSDRQARRLAPQWQDDEVLVRSGEGNRRSPYRFVVRPCGGCDACLGFETGSCQRWPA